MPRTNAPSRASPDSAPRLIQGSFLWVYAEAWIGRRYLHPVDQIGTIPGVLGQQQVAVEIDAVSYTHLTLPTKRIV